MGLFKAMLERQSDEGFLLVDDSGKLVCSECIADRSLSVFIGRLGPIERCGFCGGAGRHGTLLETLFSYMARSIAAEYDDPALGAAAWDPEDGAYVGVAPMGSDELLYELGEPLANENLRQAFVAAFDHDWCRVEPYRLSHDQRLRQSWDGFTRYVKEEARFLFLQTGRTAPPHSELFEPAAMLEELRVSILNSSLIRRLPAGSELWRARQHVSEKTLATPGELGSPPRPLAGANRMSPAGIAMFYGADTQDTALAELHLEPQSRRVTVATWSTARELAYFDLADIEIPSIFNMTARPQRPWRLFLRQFAATAAQPVRPDSAGIDYVPTQIVTEFVRHVLLDADGTPVQGIRYRSATPAGGISWVLFVDDSGCVEAVPGWKNDPSNWLGLDRASIRHFETSWVQVYR